jgi:hypothetical protein
MELRSHRIPEHLATAVFTRAARLHLQSQGHLDSYSLAELLEAGQAANIPPEYIHQALHELHQPPTHQGTPTRWRLLALALVALTCMYGVWQYVSCRQPASPPQLETLMQRKTCPQCALNGADLRGRNLSNAHLEGANLRGADLTGANLSNANLRGADLRGAILDQANLTAADLSGAMLNGAQIQLANLTGAKLIATRLTASTFAGSDLSHANFTTADLDHVNFSSAILTYTDFTAAKNRETANFSGAKR